MLPLITSIPSLLHFQTLLKDNPGVVLIKLGATWCGPCKTIEPFFKKQLARLLNKDTCQVVLVDIDQDTEIYKIWKQKRIVVGVPSFLVYYKNNLAIFPDEFVIGANAKELELLFDKIVAIDV